MGTKKYNTVTVNVDTDVEIDIDNILYKIDTEDLLHELNGRTISGEDKFILKNIALDNCEFGAEVFKLTTMEEEMKLTLFLNILNDYTLEEIEKLLPNK